MSLWSVDPGRVADEIALVDSAGNVLDQEARYFGVGFTALIHMLSPEAVIVGGGVSVAFDLLEPGKTIIVTTIVAVTSRKTTINITFAIWTIFHEHAHG